MNQNGENTSRPVPTELKDALTLVWKHLETGAMNRKSGFHTPAIATISPNGTPDVRTVVLRYSDCSTATLRFHSDIRSPKIEQLRQQPRCAMHFYSPVDKTQIRLYGSATIHDLNEIADAAWEGSTAFARKCYGQPLGPSTPMENSDTLANLEHLDPEDARTNFLAVTIAVTEIDWLWLKHSGHRRARWRLKDGNWDGVWLAP